MVDNPAPDPASGQILPLQVDVAVEPQFWSTVDLDLKTLCQTMACATFTHIQSLGQFAGGGADSAELAIRLTSDRQLAALNFQYRGLDKPTNVLSFAALDCDDPALLDGAPLFLGDIAIAAETILKEAHDQDKSVADHLAHMVVHGTLHLLGFDHMDAGEAEHMESLEKDLLSASNIKDPYGNQELAE